MQGLSVAGIGLFLTGALGHRPIHFPQHVRPNRYIARILHWDAACFIRGAKDAPKFKNFILPLVFTKRLCDVFDDEINRIAKEVGSRAKAFKLVKADKKLLAQQHFNVGAVKNTLVPLPSMAEQDEVVANLELIDTKHDQATAKRNALQDLFRILLHELMAAKTRVHEVTI